MGLKEVFTSTTEDDRRKRRERILQRIRIAVDNPTDASAKGNHYTEGTTARLRHIAE